MFDHTGCLTLFSEYKADYDKHKMEAYNKTSLLVSVFFLSAIRTYNGKKN